MRCPNTLHNVDGGCVFIMFVRSMQRLDKQAVRLYRYYVVLFVVCDVNTLRVQWQWRMCVYARSLYVMASPWPKRWWVRNDVCLNSKVIFVFVQVWDRTLSLMCCLNMLQWLTTTTALHLCSWNNGIVFALHEQNVRFYWCVVAFEGVTLVRYSMRP